MPVTDGEAIVDIADSLFRAVEQTDLGLIEEMWNDDIAVWHTGDGAPRDHARALRVIAWFVNHTTTRHYEVLDREIFESGFVQQHILHATGTNGATIAVRVCMVVKLAANGLISRIDEYFDPADMAVLT